MFKPIPALYDAIVAEVGRFFTAEAMSGWVCARARQGVQAGKQDKLVLFSHLFSQRLHSEYFEEKWDSVKEKLTEHSKWFQNDTFQLDIVFANKSPAAKTAYTAADICVKLAMWLNTRASIARFGALGYGLFPVELKGISLLTYPSEEFRILPSFDITFNSLQGIVQDIPYAQDVEATIKRV